MDPSWFTELSDHNAEMIDPDPDHLDIGLSDSETCKPAVYLLHKDWLEQPSSINLEAYITTETRATGFIETELAPHLEPILQYFATRRKGICNLALSKFDFGDNLNSVEALRPKFRVGLKAEHLTLDTTSIQSFRGLYSVFNVFDSIEHLSFRDVEWDTDILRRPSLPEERPACLNHLRKLDVLITKTFDLRALQHLKVLHESLEELSIEWKAAWNDEIAAELKQVFNLQQFKSLKVLRLSLHESALMNAEISGLEWIDAILPDVESLTALTNQTVVSNVLLGGLHVEIDLREGNTGKLVESPVWGALDERAHVIRAADPSVYIQGPPSIAIMVGERDVSDLISQFASLAPNDEIVSFTVGRGYPRPWRLLLFEPTGSS